MKFNICLKFWTDFIFSAQGGKWGYLKGALKGVNGDIEGAKGQIEEGEGQHC